MPNDFDSKPLGNSGENANESESDEVVGNGAVSVAELLNESSSMVLPNFVVGIGASAGGLESLEKLFRNLPADTGMAFVVLQHLSPDFKSMMLELLGRDTSMTIHRAEDGLVVEANSVYLLPPKKEMIITDGRLRLTDKDRSKGVALPIDTFLESLARECGSQAIAIILSGSGSDGSRGVQEIAGRGGFVISESPKTAKFDSMPASAQASGVVDEILVPEEMGRLLAEMATTPGLTRSERRIQEELRQDSLEGIESIYQLFRRHHDIDFSVYKASTVLRRIHRRLNLSGSQNIDQYAKQLQDSPDELNSLYCDLLIGVTQFFRDPETYDLLSQTIFSEMVNRSEDGKPIRAWVAGCATGEEAYSIAILIHEAFEKVNRTPNLKLFATDVHQSSIEYAGRGIYSSESVKGVSEERLQKYFVVRENGYQVSPCVRRSIVFAPHNVLSDAPFTDLDFVSCRNMLIYFQVMAQSRALSMFHYALNKGSILLLGSSESPGALADEFDVVHERSRIYRKRRTIRLPSGFRAPVNRQAAADQLHLSSNRSLHSPRRSRDESHSFRDEVAKRIMPPSLVIDESRNLVDSYGGAEKFLQLRPGQPSLDILDLLDESLRATLSGAIGQTVVGNRPVRFSNVILKTNRTDGMAVDQAHNLTVTPLTHPSMPGKYQIISFQPLELPPNGVAAPMEWPSGELDASREHIRKLEEDLRYSNENLQATIEELETSNEELQATNEELIASNEELQSTNEELHSVNEELYTVNAEHQRKISELDELNQDMAHLLENTGVATVFLDLDLKVRRFTSEISSMFDLVHSDVGRPIQSFLPKFSLPDLLTQLQTVIKENTVRECETVADDGTNYLVRMLPYRRAQRIEGVVLMFVDVSSMEELRTRLRWMSAIVESTDDAIIGQDLDGITTSWNEGAQRLYGYSASEAIGKHVSILIPDQRKEEVNEYRQAIAAGERLLTRDTVRLCKDGSPLHVSLTVSPVYDSKGELIGISKIARNVSERVLMQEEIRRQGRQRESFLATLSHELRNPLNAALNASRLIRDSRADSQSQERAAEVIERQIVMMRTLLVDLLDMSRISHGKIRLKREPVDLCSLLHHATETVESSIQQHARRLIIRVPDHPIWVMGDSVRLVQVQVNLICNAAKYSPPDTDVTVEITKKDQWAVITVTDQGVGIDPGDLERIFDPFVQVTDTEQQSDGGLGVGLSLVKTLVVEHGGQVEASSQGRGCGSVFSVRFPIFEGALEAAADGSAVSSVIGTQGIGVSKASSSLAASRQRVTSQRIVLIEDLADARDILSMQLTLDGHHVRSFPNGETGLEAIIATHPDVALVDIGLPGIDGYEVARQTRHHPDCQSVRLIALTGYGQPSDVEKARNAGFNSHLVKPIDQDELASLIEAPALDHGQANASTVDPTES